jgi:hypothetical protein
MPASPEWSARDHARNRSPNACGRAGGHISRNGSQRPFDRHTETTEGTTGEAVAAADPAATKEEEREKAQLHGQRDGASSPVAGGGPRLGAQMARVTRGAILASTGKRRATPRIEAAARAGHSGGRCLPRPPFPWSMALLHQEIGPGLGPSCGTQSFWPGRPALESSFPYSRWVANVDRSAGASQHPKRGPPNARRPSSSIQFDQHLRRSRGGSSGIRQCCSPSAWRFVFSSWGFHLARGFVGRPCFGSPFRSHRRPPPLPPDPELPSRQGS